MERELLGIEGWSTVYGKSWMRIPTEWCVCVHVYIVSITETMVVTKTALCARACVIAAVAGWPDRASLSTALSTV